MQRRDAVLDLPYLQEKKDKKDKKDAPAAAALDVVSVDELTQKIATLEREKNKEEEYRNYMQLERVRQRPPPAKHLLRSYMYMELTQFTQFSR